MATEPPFTAALLAGALAGTTVDLTLFPLDTLKTRLQSPQGLIRSGGLTGIYRGLSSVLIGSAPGASLFFITYESTKSLLHHSLGAAAGEGKGSAMRGAGVHMLAASLGEVAACSVRVPTEVIKQRAQAGQHASSAMALRAILDARAEIGLAGVWRQLYRGWGITVMREVPFTVIQFPLWEYLKERARARRGASAAASAAARGGKEEDIGALESAFYGSVSGAAAAGLTTPLDVLKTRVMLASNTKPSVRGILTNILRDEGPKALFSGLGPRVAWISVGGAIFLGSYQWGVNTLTSAGF
ncbi:related to PET8 protein [Cephalotrichum gorgonifer]|uniref:Related to PET8 protein n=1 Tax=Cephalotrichum gorgonifer TaxID=2041049 RepID=A0AAE8N4U8_9PEZI|nr:related to PET8 protein [Cephalotrichum gorgonifer]